MTRVNSVFVSGILAGALSALAGPASASPISLGAFTFDSNQFGNTLGQSDGGTFANSNWLNVVNANPGSPGFLTGANFDTGIANIGLFGNSPLYTIGYSTPITNGTGADFGVVTTRYSTNDTITLTINGTTLSYGPGLAVSTLVPENYFYNGNNACCSTLFVTSIDLTDFAVGNGGSVNSIAVTGSPELDLIRVAGFGTTGGGTSVPEPASVSLLGMGLAALALRRRRKRS